MTTVLTILGASVRAAVQSARRAGFDTFAVDLFADVDTRACSPALRIADYPAGFLHAIAAAPSGPWMYTGGLENHPRLVAAIAREKPLWGNGADVLRRIRDPLAVAAALSQAGLPALEVQRHPPDDTDSRPWLVKPLASCGGGGIELDDRSAQVPRHRRGHYWQRYCPGLPVAAVFVTDRQQATLGGVTRQLIGVDWTGGGGFRYCGSIGPVQLGQPLMEQIEDVGNALSRRFGLRGLCGVDGVISDGQFWTVEVNPRYTASVEILQRAGCDAPIALHAAAFGATPPSSQFGPSLAAKTPIRQFGKAIVYARTDVRIGTRFVEAVSQLNDPAAEPLVADIPPLSQEISAAHPVATVFSTGSSEDELLAKLRRRCELLHASLEKSPS